MKSSQRESQKKRETSIIIYVHIYGGNFKNYSKQSSFNRVGIRRVNLKVQSNENQWGFGW